MVDTGYFDLSTISTCADLDSNRPITSSSISTIGTDTDTETDPNWLSHLFNMPVTPIEFASPDDIFANTWSTPLDLNNSVSVLKMSNSSSSPTDFAFELPSDTKTPGGVAGGMGGGAVGGAYNFTPTSGNSTTFSLPFSGYSSASSFSSSASGSFGGASFSSTDALPAISRDFSRPNVNTQQSKRPATAAGALQSRSLFGNMLEPMREAGVDETTGLFSNPFVSPVAKAPQPDVVDPKYVSTNRRVSEGHGMMAPPSWPVSHNNNNNNNMNSNTIAPAPTHSSGSFNPNPFSQIPQPFRGGSSSTNRPQTSDGLPSFGGPLQLPSARSVVGSFSGFNSQSGGINGLQPPAHIKSPYDTTNTGFRDKSDPRLSYMPTTSRSEGELTFVPIGGPVPKKRPRRRFDEIERLYRCGWNGCEKSYGTLNHLNAHVAMQKHGEKRLPTEFKDMRKAWRKKKREATAAAANGGHSSRSGGAWARNSVSSGSEYDRRQSNASIMSSGGASISGSGVDGRFPMTTSSTYSYDSRPTTSSSVASSSDGRSYYPQQNVPPFGYAQNSTSGAGQGAIPTGTGAGGIPSLQNRRDSAPQHVALPYQSTSFGFRQNEDGPTPTQQNPFPFSSSNMPGMQQQQQQQYQMPQQQQRPGTGGFPFQTLTQPMQVGMASPYGQFAFQR